MENIGRGYKDRKKAVKTALKRLLTNMDFSAKGIRSGMQS